MKPRGETGSASSCATRTILPVIWQPSLGPGDSSVSGLGDLQFSAFLSPANPGHWIWGVGPILQAPTHSNAKLGNDKRAAAERLGMSLSSLYRKIEELGIGRAGDDSDEAAS